MSECWSDTRTARKPHRCSLCRRVISPGEVYEHQSMKDGSEWWTWRNCEHCRSVVSTVWNLRLIDEDYDGWSMFDVLHDSGRVDLMRLAVGIKRQWRGFRTPLMPVPAEVPRACIDCGQPVDWPRSYTWCAPCDERRVERVNRQFESITASFARLSERRNGAA